MTSGVKGTHALASDQGDSDAEDDAINIIPSARLLKGSKQILDAVNQRLNELSSLNEKVCSSSKRGIKQISVKH